jgi:AcrR family transcriptional regulator
MRRADRMSAILATAREVFEESGYEAAKVAEIARRLGMTEGNVYAYFATKRELMMQVVAQWFRTTVAPLQEGVHGITGTRNKLRYVIWQHLKTMTENAPLCAVVLRESRAPTEGGEGTGDLHRLRAQYTEALMRVLAEGIASGELAPGTDLPLVRNLVYGTLEHVVWDALESRRTVDVERTADSLTSSNLPAIDIRPPPPAGDAGAARLDRLLDRMEAALARTAPPGEV